MAAYSSNYQFAQPPPGAPQQQQQQPQQQHQQQQFGQSPYGQPPQQQQYGTPTAYSPSYSMPPPGQGLFSPPGGLYASAPARETPQRSLSFGSGKALQQERALASFDPYASAPPAPTPQQQQPAYNNYSVSTPTSTVGGFGYPEQQPPSFPMEEMTTSPHSQFAFAQPPQYYQHSTTDQTVSDISMFSNAPPPQTSDSNAIVPAQADNGDFSEGSVDPAVIAEQERIWQEIQDRREMERIRADNGVPNPRAIIPHRHGHTSGYGYGPTRGTPARTRSMPHPNDRSQDNSLARGGVAVLDPKKDLRKQTRKMKTASGAVGGAVVGGLILGPVGVVLGASGGAAVSNKMAKSRDKRKQAEFEQRNFQKGASQSVAAKGEGSFV